MKSEKGRAVKKTSIGGQALIEGVLMKGPEKIAICTRQADGSTRLRIDPVEGVSSRFPFFRLPFFRGMGSLWDSLKNGLEALDYAAGQQGEGEEALTKKEMAGAITLGLLLGFLVFFILPTGLSGLLRPHVSSAFLLNLLEGLFRILFFFIYVFAISRDEDFRRIFMYHGAEHKAIFCYEQGEELTVENVQSYPRVHPRCGTSFAANLVIFSTLIMSFFGWPNPWLRILSRLLMIPLMVGFTYEVNRWAARHDNALSRLLQKPGEFVQRTATTREPDDGMVECAILALQAVIPEKPEDDAI